MAFFTYVFLGLFIVLIIEFNKELKKNRKAWMVVINQFQNDFQAFINSSITLEIIKENTNFQHDAAMIEMYWEVIHTRLKNADKSLTKLLEEDIC